MPERQRVALGIPLSNSPIIIKGNSFEVEKKSIAAVDGHPFRSVDTYDHLLGIVFDVGEGSRRVGIGTYPLLFLRAKFEIGP